MKRAAFWVVVWASSVGVVEARQSSMAEFLGGAGDQLGYAVSGVGDVDADGYPDVVVGAPRAVTSIGLQDGVAWIASGRFLATGLGAPRIHTWEGGPNFGQARARFGHALASADIDRDGTPDVVVGSSRDAVGGFDAGSVRIFSGATGLELARFDGSPSSAFGSSVAIAGDVNRDGWDDVLIGVPLFDTTFGVAYGRAYLYSGEWIARTSAGQIPVGPRELWFAMGTYNHDDFGHAVAPLGDLDGEGTPDFVIGCDRGGTANGGYVAVFLNGSNVAFLEISGSPAAVAAHFGSALFGCGDVDGDTIPDLCVGSYGAHTTSPAGTARGRVEVIRGAWMLAVGSGQIPTVSRSVWTREGSGDYDLYGMSVKSIGDLDLDGVPDIGVSGPQAGFGISAGPGYTDVLSGRNGDLLFRVQGNTIDAQFGRAIAGLGDVDLDGRPDLAIGAYADSTGGSAAGAVRVVRGFPAASAPACASATPNSTGAVARLVARGSASQADDALFLELTQAPPIRPVIFFRGSTLAQVPFGNGVRCVGGPMLRFGAATTGAQGELLQAFPLAPFAVGSTLVLQAWYDDAPAGGAGFNASDVAILTVVP